MAETVETQETSEERRPRHTIALRRSSSRLRSLTPQDTAVRADGARSVTPAVIQPRRREHGRLITIFFINGPAPPSSVIRGLCLSFSFAKTSKATTGAAAWTHGHPEPAVLNAEMNEAVAITIRHSRGANKALLIQGVNFVDLSGLPNIT